MRLKNVNGHERNQSYLNILFFELSFSVQNVKNSQACATRKSINNH